MDYAAMLQYHHDLGADLTVTTLTVGIQEARSFGVVTVDGQDRVILSCEARRSKPLRRSGSCAGLDGSLRFSLICFRSFARGSQGPTLPRFWQGYHSSILGYRVVAYRFGGTPARLHRYWRDVGTIDAYYEANMDLLHALRDQPLPGRLAHPHLRGQHPPARTTRQVGEEAKYQLHLAAGIAPAAAVHH
jgi:glucose-1-phosphate adenylyltransferase